MLEEESDPRRFSIHRLAHYCLDLAKLFETERVEDIKGHFRPLSGQDLFVYRLHQFRFDGTAAS